MGELVPNKKPYYALLRNMLQPAKPPRTWAEYDKRLSDSLDSMYVDSDALVIVVHASLEHMRLVPGWTQVPQEVEIYDSTIRYIVERIEHRGTTQADASIEALCHLDLLLEDIVRKLTIQQRPFRKTKTPFSITRAKVVALQEYVANAMARISVAQVAEEPIQVTA